MKKNLSFFSICSVLLVFCSCTKEPLVPEDWYIAQEYALYLENETYNAYANFRPFLGAQYKYARVRLNNGASITVDGKSMNFDQGEIINGIEYPNWSYSAKVAGPEVTFNFVRNSSHNYVNTLSLKGLYSMYPVENIITIIPDKMYYFDWIKGGAGPDLGENIDGKEKDVDTADIDYNAIYEAWLIPVDDVTEMEITPGIKGWIDPTIKAFYFSRIPTTRRYKLILQCYRNGDVQNSMQTVLSNSTQEGIIMKYNLSNY